MALADYRMATDATLALAKAELANIVAKLNAIDGHVDDLATNATLVLVKTELANIVTKLNTIDGHIDDLATDATLALAKTELENIVSKLQTLDGHVNTLAKDATLQTLDGHVNTLAKDETLQTLDGHVNTLAKDATLQMLDGHVNTLAKDSTLSAFDSHVHSDLGENGILASLLNGIVEVLASVKSVNGKYGVVVLDSGDILITKNQSGSKTVKQVLTELQTAVAATPLTFTVSEIGETGKYKLIVTQGTPS